ITHLTSDFTLLFLSYIFLLSTFFFFFFFNVPATTKIYTLSLHDALPILNPYPAQTRGFTGSRATDWTIRFLSPRCCTQAQLDRRSEEHTSELQSRGHLVCRLLLEKKKKQTNEILRR